MSLLDIQYYLDNNPDLAAAAAANPNFDAKEHFALFGYDEGRAPMETAANFNLFFNPILYLRENPDVAAAAEASTEFEDDPIAFAVDHYITFGYLEGRDPQGALGFDASAYLEDNPDLVAAGVNAAEHYLNFGAAEGRDPSPSPVTDGVYHFLTDGVDHVFGTNNADLIFGDVVQNMVGMHVNSLGTGDRLDGKGGTDELEAQVLKGAYVGGGNTPVQPRTTDIEEVRLEALNSDLPGTVGAAGQNSEVFVDAGDMWGLERIGSWESDANLTIQDLTTLADNGSTVRSVSDMTVTMAYTGNSDHDWDESDLKVYFDQDYLACGTISQSRIVAFLLDEDAELAGEANRLLNIDVDGLRFTYEGTEINLQDAAAQTAGTHQGFVDALQDELQALIDDGTLPEGTTLVLDPTITDVTFLDDGSQSDLIPAMVLTPGDSGTVEAIGFSRVEEPIGEYDVYGRISDDFEEDADPPTINIELEKAGRFGDGGELVIGGMNKDGDNVWKGGCELQNGIPIFDVEVVGGSDKPSSLAVLRSTNNRLEAVYISTAAANVANPADLTIGNSNTNEDAAAGDDLALKDVKTIDATEFEGDLDLNFVGITAETESKYLDRVDTQDNPAADNDQFDYSFGSGDDGLDLEIDWTILAREDFEIDINTGAGDDAVNLNQHTADNYTAARLLNQQLNHDDGNNASNTDRQVTISTGANDDTVTTGGAGNTLIDAGSGNDAVYTDNTGDNDINGVRDEPNAQFVFNAQGTVPFQQVGNEGSNSNTDDSDRENDVVQIFDFYKGTVQVTFQGIESGFIDIPYSGGSTTTLEINQAIKEAVNSHETLSDVILAQDGPGNTLIITSLIDGQIALDELDVTVWSPLDFDEDTWTETELYQYEMGRQRLTEGEQTAIEDGDGGLAAFNAEADAADALYETEYTYNGADPVDGIESGWESDNEVDLGTGIDTLVMGTGQWSEDTLLLDDDFGRNTVFHFDIGTADDDRDNAANDDDYYLEADYLNFTAATEGGVGIKTWEQTQTPTDGVILDATGTLADGNAYTVTIAGVYEDYEFWRDMTESQVLSVLNGDPNNNSTGGFNEGLDADGDPDDASDYILMVENAFNLGEYKVYHLTADANNDGDFADADYLGILDIAEYGDAVVAPDEVSITTADGSAVAEGSDLVFTIELGSVQATDVTVDYALGLVGGAAAGDFNFGGVSVAPAGSIAPATATTGTLTFAAGVTEIEISIPTLDDPTDELEAEGLSLTLSNPTGGITLGEAGPISVTITDDDEPGAVTVVDLDTLGGTAVLPVATSGDGGEFQFTDDVGTISNTEISDFGADDSMVFEGVVEGDVAVSVSGGNTTFEFDDGAGNTSQITLIGVSGFFTNVTEFNNDAAYGDVTFA